MKSSKPSRWPGLPEIKPPALKAVYRVLRKAHGHQHWWPGDSPYEVMIGAILTQNTAWTNVEKALANLKNAGVLSARSMRRMPLKRLAALIRPAGYPNLKAARLKNFLLFYEREYGSSIRNMRAETTPVLRARLLSVHGIGPETADAIALYAAQKPAFVIDAYTRRIFSRHGLFAEGESYDAWRTLFMKALPRSRALFNDFHAQIVLLAKRYCRASRPLCEGCPLAFRIST